MAEQRWQCEICKKTYLQRREAEQCEESHPKLIEAFTVVTDFNKDKDFLLTVKATDNVYRFMLPFGCSLKRMGE